MLYEFCSQYFATNTVHIVAQSHTVKLDLKRFPSTSIPLSCSLGTFGIDTCYCIALCHYMMRQYAAALKFISEIIERGIKEHPG